MKSRSETIESQGFDELLEFRLRRLLTNIGIKPLVEVEAELSSLSRLIENYKRKDELLEGLLDPGIPDRNRRDMLMNLNAQRLIVAQSRSELESLHTKSHALIARSVQLFIKGYRQVYARRNPSAAYGPEICGYCKGFGRRNRTTCDACKGQRFVLVYQPAIICPRCKGDGAATPNELGYLGDFCIVCRGKGWALALDDCSE